MFVIALIVVLQEAIMAEVQLGKKLVEAGTLLLVVEAQLIFF